MTLGQSLTTSSGLFMNSRACNVGQVRWSRKQDASPVERLVQSCLVRNTVVWVVPATVTAKNQVKGSVRAEAEQVLGCLGLSRKARSIWFFELFSWVHTLYVTTGRMSSPRILHTCKFAPWSAAVPFVLCFNPTSLRFGDGHNKGYLVVRRSKQGICGVPTTMCRTYHAQPHGGSRRLSHGHQSRALHMLSDNNYNKDVYMLGGGVVTPPRECARREFGLFRSVAGLLICRAWVGISIWCREHPHEKKYSGRACFSWTVRSHDALFPDETAPNSGQERLNERPNTV